MMHPNATAIQRNEPHHASGRRRFALRIGQILAIVVCLSVLGVAFGHSQAATGDWVRGINAQARLISAVDATGDASSLPLGIEVQLDQGWKTYWRSPGDAGLPPGIDWSESRNVAGAELRYPVPHRFTLFGLETFGYDTAVLFPLTVRTAEPGQPVELRIALDLLVCSDICVPERLELGLALPAGPARPDADAANALARAAASVPGDGAAHGLSVSSVALDRSDQTLALVVRAEGREPFADPDMFVEVPAERAGQVAFGRPAITFGEGDRALTIRVPLIPGPSATDAAVDLDGQSLTFTLVDGRRSAELVRTVGGSAPALFGATGGLAQAPTPETSAGLMFVMLGTALLGGLILNLMPCVLPVLSLKLFGIAASGGRAPREIRSGFLASAAGIVSAFWVLAAGVIGFQWAGAAVGWGLQFQSPLFLLFMLAVVTLFACNLFGLFEVPVPQSIADAAVRGSGDGGHPSLAGHFMTGVFATLLATPCSAPFLGTAVSFALARGPFEVMAIFTALGIGLALPYLLVAAVPRTAALLPRPGRWMLTLKRVLGGLLVLTGLWLLSVLVAQIGFVATAGVAAAMLAAAGALWLRSRLQQSHWRFAGGAAAAALLIGGVLPTTLLAVEATQPASSPSAPASVAGSAGAVVPWQPFVLARVESEVASGRTVFVDVTADWCVTCQVNKRLVLNRAAVSEVLSSPGVVALKADWTRPDPAIAAYLQAHGRYGIPFNAVYGPGAPGGILLSELLSESMVLDALTRAQGPSR